MCGKLWLMMLRCERWWVETTEEVVVLDRVIADRKAAV